MASSLSCSLVPLLTTRFPVPSHSVPGPVTVALEHSRSDGMSLSFSPRHGFHLRGSRFFSLGSLPPRKAGHRSPMRGHSGGAPGRGMKPQPARTHRCRQTGKQAGVFPQLRLQVTVEPGPQGATQQASWVSDAVQFSVRWRAFVVSYYPGKFWGNLFQGSPASRI